MVDTRKEPPSGPSTGNSPSSGPLVHECLLGGLESPSQESENCGRVVPPREDSSHQLIRNEGGTSSTDSLRSSPSKSKDAPDIRQQHGSGLSQQTEEPSHNLYAMR